LFRLRVTAAEIRIVLQDANGTEKPIRTIIESVANYVINYEAYEEVKIPGSKTILKSIGPQGSMHLQAVNTPYPSRHSLQPKRSQAHVVGTTYCYDFPEIFRQAIRKSWAVAVAENPALQVPSEVLISKELVLDENGWPQETARAPGMNNIGMVAFMFNMKTPEYPTGRRVIVLANDITFQIGSFGPKEDEFFFKVTQLARSLGVPRIYLSANSGARLGIADELMNDFHPAWVDASKPEKGFKYLYITPEKAGELNSRGQKTLFTEQIEEDGEVRYKIIAIVGARDGLGVESLKGSGLIAGETSRAYDDIFTATLVTCRSVGIGAYLVRLGQRVVQVQGQPIILTGNGALNKVLGREVYSSNLQLGGTQIMYRNGVSHLAAANDLEGVSALVTWLSYVPESRGLEIPVYPTTDTWEREIGYTPVKGPYDPRWFIAGQEQEDGSFLSGFFDKGSFQETLSGWAQTVVSTIFLCPRFSQYRCPTL
jgi:acetyl-CoA carboxylase / biotin carboxylase 1